MDLDKVSVKSRELALRMGKVLLEHGDDEHNEEAIAILVRWHMRTKTPPRWEVWVPVTKAICDRFRNEMKGPKKCA